MAAALVREFQVGYSLAAALMQIFGKEDVLPTSLVCIPLNVDVI